MVFTKDGYVAARDCKLNARQFRTAASAQKVAAQVGGRVVRSIMYAGSRSNPVGYVYRVKQGEK